MKATAQPLPVPYFQVLREEEARLQGQPLPEIDWAFTAGQIRNSDQLMEKLAQPNNAYFAGLRTKQILDQIADYFRLREELTPEGIERARKIKSTIQTEIARQLNTLVDYDKSLLHHPDYPGDAQSEETRQWGRNEVSDEDLPHLNRKLLEAAYSGYVVPIEEAQFKKFHSEIHKRPRAALCLSGGGIRSATFGLGILQGLAGHGIRDPKQLDLRKQLMRQFDYLSTVSGGGYIGAWFSSWVTRHPEGLSGVAADLANSRPESASNPEPAPLRHLREFSNYLSPRLGWLSMDMWTLVGTYLRNLLLNWVVVIPLLLALVSLPWLLAAAVIAAPGAGVRTFVLVAGFVLMLISVTYLLINRPSVSNFSPVTRRWRRFQTHSAFRQFGLSSLLGAGLLLTMWWAWQVEAPGRNAVMLLLAGTLLLSWILQRSFLWWKEGRAWFHPGIKTVGTEALVLLGIGVLGGFLLWTAGTRLPPLLWEWPAGTMERIGWGDVYTCVAVPVFLGIFLLTATVYIGISSRWSAIAIEDRDLEYWGRAGSWLLLGSLLWILLSGLVVFSPKIFVFLSSNWAAGAAWIATGIFALLAGGSGKTPAAKSGEAAAPLTRLLNGGVKLAAPLAIAFILILLAVMADRLIREAPKWEGLVNVLQQVEGYLQLRPLVISDAPEGSENSVLMVVVVLGALAVFGSGAAALINMNRFSLHGVYRNRLIRAFLGASRLRRHPHWFTGFDEDDNMAISHLKPGFLQPEHLLDPVKLVSELKQPGVRSRVLSRHLLEVFKDRSPTLVKMIREHRDFEWPSRELSHELVQELNTVLAGPSLLEQSLDFEECDLGPGEQPLKQPTYIFRRAVRRLSIFRFLSRPAGPSLEAEVPVVDEETCPPEIRELSARHTDTVLVNRYILAWQYEGLIAPPADQAHRPLHVVNAALNLSGGDNLAWQERKADSFTISAFHCGNRRLGYRRSEDYGHGPNHGIALGTAVTISGAAASPNMGYHSSPAVTFLLALFNVRLGCWLGNPGIHGKETFRLWAPRVSLLPFLHEALGHTRDQNPYVYLSDGGHFENLGLYEMVLRRCRFIILSDAGADPKCQLGDLANAIRKIRVDLGVPIEFDNFDIKKRDVLPPGKYCAIGRIQYSRVDEGAMDGLLLYIKPSLCGKEPRDIFNYQEGSQFFPHEPTSDQFFSESQFESYRTLGIHIVQKIARHWPKPETLCMREKTPLEQFIAAAHAYVGEKPSCPCEDALGGNGGAQTPEQKRNARISVNCPFEEL